MERVVDLGRVQRAAGLVLCAALELGCSEVFDEVGAELAPAFDHLAGVVLEPHELTASSCVRSMKLAFESILRVLALTEHLPLPGGAVEALVAAAEEIRAS